MTDIVPIVTALASTAIERGMTGVVAAYDTIPSTIPDGGLPCFINIPWEGEIGGTLDVGSPEMFGSRLTVHKIKVQLLCSLQADQADSDLQARPFLRRFVGTITNFKTLNGTTGVVSAEVKSYRYGHIQLRQGEPGYLGWEFMLHVEQVDENVIYGTSGPAL